MQQPAVRRVSPLDLVDPMSLFADHFHPTILSRRCTHSAIQDDKGLVATSKAAHHAISALFDKPYDPVKEGGLVVQYEVKLQNGLECGGAYMKLLTESPEVRYPRLSYRPVLSSIR
jgi:hypothetical protein